MAKISTHHGDIFITGSDFTFAEFCENVLPLLNGKERYNLYGVDIDARETIFFAGISRPQVLYYVCLAFAHPFTNQVHIFSTKMPTLKEKYNENN